MFPAYPQVDGTSSYYFSSFIKNFKGISKDTKLFRKILSVAKALPYPGELKNIIKTSLAFSDTNLEFDYLKRIYNCLIGSLDEANVNTLYEEGFTIREIEKLKDESKSSIARKLNKEKEIDEYTSLFTQRNEVYSGSEATVFHLVKLFSLQQILKHDYPIVVDSFRAEDLSTGKEEIVLEISRSIGNQVILTTTLKHEELGKYDSVEGINHIDYLSHTPSKILDGRYVREFLNLLSSLSIIVQR